MRRVVVGLGIALVVVGIAAGGFLYWLLAGSGVRLALERQATAWLGAPVHIGVARARLFPKPGLHVENVQVGNPVGLTLGSVDVTSDGRALLSRRIEHASIAVSNSRVAMPLPFALPDASAPAGQSPTSDAIQLVSIQSISLHDIVLASRGRELTISAESALTPSRLVLRSLTARAGGTALEAEGEIALRPRIDARLKLKANRLDVDELIALTGAFVPATGTPAAGTRPAARIAARVSAESATAGGVTVRQFATDLEVDGARLLLSPMTFQIFGGRYQGSLTATLRDTMSATLRSRFLDLKVDQIAAFAGSPGAATGTLTSAGTFSGTGPDVAGVLRSASGTGTASITDGTIQHLNLVRTVILFFGRPAPDAAPASDTFQRLDASFALADRVLTANALSLHSDDADMVGRGALALDSKALNGRVDISLSEALTAQAGTDLARYTREGNRIVLPASIGGTIGAPRLSIDAASAIKRGLKNELQRRLGNILNQLGQGQQTTQP
jgi:uncharacterized protein involved in outer membrane biogenesis